jgi:mannose-P-dolichol utilization defect protein 1
MTRIFTTIQEVNDSIILYNFIAGAVLNFVLAAQMVYYWNSPTSKHTPEHKLTPGGQMAVKQPFEHAAHTVQHASQDVREKVEATGREVAGQVEEKKGSPSTRRRG